MGDPPYRIRIITGGHEDARLSRAAYSELNEEQLDGVAAEVKHHFG